MCRQLRSGSKTPSKKADEPRTLLSNLAAHHNCLFRRRFFRFGQLSQLPILIETILFYENQIRSFTSDVAYHDDPLSTFKLLLEQNIILLDRWRLEVRPQRAVSMPSEGCHGFAARQR